MVDKKKKQRSVGDIIDDMLEEHSEPLNRLLSASRKASEEEDSNVKESYRKAFFAGAILGLIELVNDDNGFRNDKFEEWYKNNIE